MHEKPIAVEEVLEEGKQNPYSTDSLGIFFNHLGMEQFGTQLNLSTENGSPIYNMPLTNEKSQDVFLRFTKLLPYQKGVQLRVTAPQKRRKLISYLTMIILEYINKPELANCINIIHEMTANSEKANLENTIRINQIASSPKDIQHLMMKERETIFRLCEEQKKWVKISWKFSDKILKIEVKNNTIIEDKSVTSVKDKVSMKLNTLVDGYVEEAEDKIGAGLGLFFVSFFKDELKEKYDFETLFRIYQNDVSETVTSLTVIFDKSTNEA